MSRQTADSAVVIGLEVHLQLNTATKIFCGCPTRFGAPPNSQVCPVCLGFPGVLPVLNRQVLRYGIRVALGLNCSIQPKIVFHRKNYFYPDLPKAFQISQYDLPLGSSGFVDLENKKVRINRVHMEEDAGKLIHKEGEPASLVDYNRCGIPLLEIVSEPDLCSPEEAYAYLKTLKGILQYLEVSDCDMEKGSLRCDANVSLRPQPDVLGAKVEIKNLNSFKAVARSLSYEIRRQGEILEEGGRVVQETRLWDDVKGVTQGMRSKEFAHDYRYFPEPDLVPFSVSTEEVEAVRAALPELPAQRARRFMAAYGLPPADARQLTAEKATADYFEQCVKALPAPVENKRGKVFANWIVSDISREINERGLENIQALGFPPSSLIELIGLVESGAISGKMAKEVFIESLASKKSPAAVVAAKGMSQVTDRQAIREAALAVIQEQPKAAEDFRNGKAQALMFMVGQLMKKTKGAASPAISQEILKELLGGENS
ncbi:MAG: Asp-tRNA(Asn)/Glu-tRNA(Gln) amidotransferase subunit GatB [Candidatus Omnitrophica bacterium]|nr:Asp-tRNA(Asn)/Glu-tRNA(Gln) amidotransferase subunit GatB [Candidatus Omnitrophota bacterium]